MMAPKSVYNLTVELLDIKKTRYCMIQTRRLPTDGLFCRVAVLPDHLLECDCLKTDTTCISSLFSRLGNTLHR